MISPQRVVRVEWECMGSLGANAGGDAGWGSAAFGAVLREMMDTADIQSLKAYLGAVIVEVRVGDENVEIVVDKASLAAVIAESLPPWHHLTRWIGPVRLCNPLQTLCTTAEPQFVHELGWGQG